MKAQILSSWLKPIVFVQVEKEEATYRARLAQVKWLHLSTRSYSMKKWGKSMAVFTLSSVTILSELTRETSQQNWVQLAVTHT